MTPVLVMALLSRLAAGMRKLTIGVEKTPVN
jgi:hypothetical protein